MNRFPDFQTDLLFSDNPPVEGESPAKATDAHAAPEAAAADHGHEATTTQPAPLAPQVTGNLPEPISGGQSLLLALFGLLALCLLIAMTRYGRKYNYGD